MINESYKKIYQKKSPENIGGSLVLCLFQGRIGSIQTV